ncbi:MAG: P-loop NTPase fold protein [Pseudomonadota bacterium]
MYRLLSDQPERIADQFNFDAMAKILKTVVIETPPPFTIGIFGEWGSGKTTLMHRLDAQLLEGGQKTVWFNAWRYDGKEVVWNALIQSIFLAMQSDEDVKDADFKARLIETGRNLARFAARKAIAPLTGGLVTAEHLDKAAALLSPLTADDPQFKFINEFEAGFRSLVSEYVGENGRLVVFVDDLDRCLPETAVEVLEAIKLYLDNANVTFVIGVEPEVVRQGIRHRYQNNEVLAEKEYLEKIVQLPFMMRGLDDEMAMRLLRPYAKTAPYVDDPVMTGMIFAATEKNPRRIKRFINTFYVLTEMQRVAGRTLEREDTIRLALALLTQLHFREIFQIMERSHGIVQRWNENDTKPSRRERENAIAESPDLQAVDDVLRAKDLFAQVRDIDCSDTAMKPWITLTRGDDPR